jgi:hypothetical protein
MRVSAANDFPAFMTTLSSGAGGIVADGTAPP